MGGAFGFSDSACGLSGHLIGCGKEPDNLSLILFYAALRTLSDGQFASI